MVFLESSFCLALENVVYGGNEFCFTLELQSMFQTKTICILIQLLQL